MRAREAEGLTFQTRYGHENKARWELFALKRETEIILPLPLALSTNQFTVEAASRLFTCPQTQNNPYCSMLTRLSCGLGRNVF